MKPTLGLALIVKDEEGPLKRLLESVAGVFDQIVVVDTGSTDKTKEVAAGFGAEIHDFKWIDDFSAARNHAFSYVKCDYIMWLDADDILSPDNRQKLIDLKPRLGEAQAFLMIYEYAQDEAGNPTLVHYRERIVQNTGEKLWHYPIHECMFLPEGWGTVTTDIRVTHLRTGADIAKDTGRNLRIIEKAFKRNPQDRRLQFYWAKELHNEGKHERAIEALRNYLKEPDWHENMVNARQLLAESYLHTGNKKTAMAECLEGIRLDPRWAEFYVLMGDIYYHDSQWAAAAHWFELAKTRTIPETLGFVLSDNYTWIPHDRLAKCYSEMGQLYRSYDESTKALAFRPWDERLIFNQEFLRDLLFERQADRPIRLNLGSGKKRLPAYRSCDIFQDPAVDFTFDLVKPPFHPHSVHAIYSEHSLEHAPSHYEARDAIKKWARVLRREGLLTLKVPDLELCARNFLEASDRPRRPEEQWTEKEWYRYTIYGIQKSQGGEPDEAQHHRTGFTKAELRRLLEESGFKIKSLVNYDGWGTPSIEVKAFLKAPSIRVTWLLTDTDEINPSVRIRRLNVHHWLRKNGVTSTIHAGFVRGNRDIGALMGELRNQDVVVFTSFGEVEAKLIEKLSLSGVATVYDHNEDLWGYPYLKECLSTVSRIACCSERLTDSWVHHNRCTVLRDAYEEPREKTSREYGPHGRNGRLRAVWCGMGGNAHNVDFLRPILKELDMELRVISEWDNADKKWNFSTWLEDLADADIAVIPQRVDIQPAKSNNKATQAMALGLPVVTSSLPAYKEAIIPGKTGFICESPDEWKAALTKLKDQALREKVGRAAQLAVRERYSIDAMGKEWIAFLEELCRENCRPPEVDIVIPTWNNLKYLKHCIRSIRSNTYWPHRIIVVNSGDDASSAWIDEQPDVVHIRSKERLHFASATNMGIRSGSAPFVCLLNDDTIVGAGWLTALMREAMKPHVGAVGPFSNCDQGFQHEETIPVAGVSLRPNMKIEEVKDILPEIQAYRRKKQVHDREWVAFYATLIPRSMFNELGLLDENFKSGDEDLDFCRRIRQLGYRICQTWDSWVFHFGGKTRKKSDKADPEKHWREDVENHRYFEKKWSLTPNEKPRFVLYTGAAWERWSPASVDQGGIGGSETCAVYVARAFAKKGFESVVFSDCEGHEGVHDGVEYRNYPKFNEYIASNHIDFFVASRTTDVFALPISADFKVVWVHDIWLSEDPRAKIFQKKVDKYFVLSPWHRDFFSKHHNVPPEKLHVTRDGIDLARFEGKAPARVRNRLIYSSSPDRGLATLLKVLPRIRKQVPKAELHVFYGFDNWEKAARLRGDKGELEHMQYVKTHLKDPGVHYHGRVGQKELARQFQKADLWAYPTWFSETFCITAAEAMAAGVPIVTSNLAALSTTVGDAGVLIDGDSMEASYQNRFVDECVRMLKNRKHWKDYSKRGRENAKSFSWDTIADEWLELLAAVK